MFVSGWSELVTLLTFVLSLGYISFIVIENEKNPSFGQLLVFGWVGIGVDKRPGHSCAAGHRGALPI